MFELDIYKFVGSKFAYELLDLSGRRLTLVWRTYVLRVQCNIEEVKVFESLRVDPDLDAPAPSSPSHRRQ